MFNGKKISVALCSYNGALYIEEQLNSILEQTVIPDEIVISDDGSKDDTLKIIDKISKSEKAKGVEFKIHTDNPIKGWKHNFEWILNFVTGDYIFNCDQDDVWMPTKVEEVISTFIAHPDALMVAHNLENVDKNLNALNPKALFYVDYKHLFTNKCIQLPKEIGAIPQSQYLDDVTTIQTCFFNGMVECMRKELLSKILPFPNDAHFDQWEYFCALFYGEIYFINKKLTKYRQHGNNVTSKFATKNKIKILLILLKHRELPLDFKLPNVSTRQCKVLEETNHTDTALYNFLKEISEYERKRAKAVKNGRFIGFFRWIKMYLTDTELRTSLRLNAFLVSLLQLTFGKIDKIPDDLK